MSDEGREIVVVSIKDGSKTILDWFGFECGPEQNFHQLFEALSIASQSDVNNNRFKSAIDHDFGSVSGKAGVLTFQQPKCTQGCFDFSSLYSVYSEQF